MPFDLKRLPAMLALAAVASLTSVLVGCGGSGSSGGTDIRAIDAIPNGGNASISLSATPSAPLVTNETFFNATLYAPTASATQNLAFTLSQDPGTIFPTSTDTFANGSYYTETLFGRADILNPADPRYPTLVNTLDDRTSPQLNDVRIRVANAAPDLGPVDVSIYNSTITPSTVIIGTNVPYKTITAETETVAGTYPITVDLTGTSTTVTGPKTFDLLAGDLYTVYVTEPVVSPTPTYDIQIVNDSAVSPTPITN